MSYTGEVLWAGYAGNFFVATAFVAAILSAFAFSLSVKKQSDENWASLGRQAFYVHILSVASIVAVLFYLLLNHRFEYHYVWQHSSKDLPFRYILSCFWEGQEGSFLLWLCWHSLLGFLLLRKKSVWQTPVMAVVASVQVFLASMLLGVYIWDIKIGSSPFLLLREHADMEHLPVFQNPDYLLHIDGRGLNPLLQNYWMTIHPPVLFLGFAATLIPFAFAIAGIWKREPLAWIAPALPWSWFAVLSLAAGILMGGAWAYEALSFGGFWAWDPVENASLVPWLILVGAVHLMIVNKKKPQSLLITFIFTFLSFLLVLYSTYLTRSGILGETSVHSFADGLPGQLIVFLLFYVFLCMALLVWAYRQIPRTKEEEKLSSREFWMFLGSLILFLSALQIIASTSIPVFNAVLGSNMAPPNDAVSHYNTWQVPFAILICLLMSFSLFLKFGKSDLKVFFRKILIPLVAAFVFTLIWAYFLRFSYFLYALLLFVSLFAMLANAFYFIREQEAKLSKAGAAIAHIGFALIMLGSLISTGKKQVISHNTSGVHIQMSNEPGKDANAENVMLIKGDTVPMGDYHITYTGQTKEGINIYYQVDYFTKEGTAFKPAFTLRPRIQTNKLMGNVPEPDTKHFLHKDIFTYVTYADLEKEANDTSRYQEKTIQLQVGDTAYSGAAMMVLKSIDKSVQPALYKLPDSAIAVGANLHVKTPDMQEYAAMPIMAIVGNRLQTIPDSISELGLLFRFMRIHTETGQIEIQVREEKVVSNDFIIMQAIIFPGINILWIGCVVMAFGTLLAIFARIKKAQKNG